jgi:cyclophilin family peptidyl-prolyl cis-trans isomerase
MRERLTTLVLVLACAAVAGLTATAAGASPPGEPSRETATEAARDAGTIGLAETATVGPVEAVTEAAEAPPRLASERLVLRTNMGDLVLAFYPEVAPRHIEQILKLARAGVYDGQNIFRVEPGFVAQLADARGRSPELSAEQLSLISRLAPELSRLRHGRGTLSMARYESQPDSAETSFSILFGDAPHLDGKYTVFGKLEAGYDVLDAIGRVARDSGNRPLRPVIIRRAEVIESPEALAALSLRGPDFSEQQPAFYHFLRRAAWGLGACAALGLALFAAAGRGRVAQWAGSAGLLLVLVGFFGLLVALLPEARTTGWSSVPLFAGVVILFKLMNRFESGRPQTRAGN